MRIRKKGNHSMKREEFKGDQYEYKRFFLGVAVNSLYVSIGP
ncbi:hypothetical protein [Halalkalibacter sp. APA_J-10(15)]|nr:hypothetical protein [Halalkalibacter sp. APA_J-10(15)]